MKIDIAAFKKFLESDTLLNCVVFILIVKVIFVALPINFPKNIFFADITKVALENMANQTRQAAGLQPLQKNAELGKAAQMKAENMLAENYFAHTSPSGISPWHWFLKSGYNYKYAGENLAIGFFESQEVFSAWLNSPSHKANILNPNYKEVGTAVISGFGENKAVVVVQEFGAQKPVAAAKSANPVASAESTIPDKSANADSGFRQNDNSEKKVLSQSAAKEKTHSYGIILQDIIYGISLVFMSALVVAIIYNTGLIFEKKFVFRSLIIVILLLSAIFLNKEAIMFIISRQASLKIQ